jgi:hypothetical protein
VVPCVVRKAAFDDTNTLLQDLIDVLEDHRLLFAERSLQTRIQNSGKVCAILLARRELGVPIASSPVRLPDWFPIGPGELHTGAIHDLSWTANVPLSTPEAKTPELASLLYELDGLIVEQLKRSRSRDHNLVMGFFDRIKKSDGSGETFDMFIASAEQSLKRVTSPSGFRPSVRERGSLTARIWLLANTTTTDQLSSAGKAVADALGMSLSADAKPTESVLSVLNRPSTPDLPQARWGRNLLATVRAACQFMTAAAHADSYPEFPITLVKSMSLDLRSSLESTCEDLNRLST